LGVYSTQRNGSYHVVVKRNLNKSLTISAAVEALVSQTADLAEECNERINKDRRSTPTLMDKQAFRQVKGLLTHYAMSLVNGEYIMTKELSDEIDRGEVLPSELDEAIGCNFGANYRLDIDYLASIGWCTYCNGSNRHVHITFPCLPQTSILALHVTRPPVFIPVLHSHTLFPFFPSLVSLFYRQNLWDQDIASSSALLLDIAHTGRHTYTVRMNLFLLLFFILVGSLMAPLLFVPGRCLHLPCH